MITVGDLFVAIPIDQSFEILELLPKGKAIALVKRNGFEGEHEVNLNTISVHLLNPDLYVHLSHLESIYL